MLNRPVRVWLTERKGRGFVMRWEDAGTGKRKERKCKDQTPRGAQREATRLEDEINNPATGPTPIGEILFSEVHEAYTNKRLKGKSSDYAYQLKAGVKRVYAVAADRGLSPLFARDITTEFMVDVMDLLTDEVAIATAKSYRGSLTAFLNWAHSVGHCQAILWKACSIDGAVEARGRPLHGDEIDRLLIRCRSELGDRSAQFRNVIQACYLSGMRLSEALMLHAYDTNCHTIERPRGEKPRFVFCSKQKNGKKQYVILTPEFEKFIQGVKPDNEGWYFRPRKLRGGAYDSPKDVGRVISHLGKACGIVSKRDPAGNILKYATAHDLRRSFAARWAAKVKPFVLQHLMRHEDIKTTMQYYAGDLASLVSTEVWGESFKAINQFAKELDGKG